ncbi:uncharacterized protein HaLaN_09525 [Haematococcus lacustris]|uniref:Uncharacterized protein n=1 Tax=Haematococcus lacustris TaxID=44745 RepID=A0A699YVL1_HAELA|nr:uncharacterized protein HaLaN_09525 [Haematococcus lacustris]
MQRSRQRSRANEARAFQAELEGIDDDIDAYLAQDRWTRDAPGAALVLQAAWRARAPRIHFNRYYSQRQAALRRQLRSVLGPLRKLVLALRHQRLWLLRSSFREWRQLGELKMLLFAKVMARLKGSMTDIRESQSPQRLWRLCTAPGQDPWRSKISLGALCRNLLLTQAPRRKMGAYFGAWRQSVAVRMQQRSEGVAVLQRLEARRTRDWLHLLFRPRIDIWDDWLWEHNRSRELAQRVNKLHSGYRLRHCFDFLRSFSARNTKMRMAWLGVAAHQIEELMRHCLNCFKAHWQFIVYKRRTHRAVFRCVAQSD